MNIGVTGHQNLHNADWVKEQIIQALRREKTSPTGITSLAIGADQLFAQCIIECGGRLKIIIPFAEYAKAFKDQGLVEYHRLLLLASATEVLPYVHSDEEGYFNAGKRVADISDLLIAVWNGRPAAGIGGTADIVEYAQQQGKYIIHIDPELQTVSIIARP